MKHHWSRKEIDFIKSQETLDLMVGMSLSDRCEILKLQMPDTHITIYKLRKLYRELGIKKKVIRFTKIPDRA